MSDESFADVHHIAIAVPDLDDALADYGQFSGHDDVVLRADLPDFGVSAAAVQVGSTEVEFIAPLGSDSGIAKFIAKRGPGLHHIAYAVPDITAAMQQLRSQGRRLIDEEPRMGLHGSLVCFVHPAGAGGVLTELVESA